MMDNHSSATKKEVSTQQTGSIGNIGSIRGDNNPTISGATGVNITTNYNISLERPGSAPLKPLAGNVARSAGPATRSRKKSHQVQPSTSRLVRIRDIKPKLVSKTINWYIKVRADRMFNDEPQVGKGKSYFHCLMSDASGMKIYISFFLRQRQKCKKVYKKVAKSSQGNPVFLSGMRVEKQKRKYKQPQGSYYKLVFNDESEITRS